MLTYKVWSDEFYVVGQGELEDSLYDYVVAVVVEGEPGHEVEEVWIARLTQAQYERALWLVDSGFPILIVVTEVVVGDFELSPGEVYENVFVGSALDLDRAE